MAFRFCDRRDTDVFAPGFERLPTTPANALGFGAVDHITSNAQTMASVGLWFEHVLGMERYWGIEFHTEDVKQGGETGTGLRSIVYWDPRSQLKFPINEPLSPFFKEGQINRFIEDNAGAGVQHIALQVADVVQSVQTLRERGISFLETPGSYYDQAPPASCRSAWTSPRSIMISMCCARLASSSMAPPTTATSSRSS
ncbi:MAG: VOC family protein [bacterium]